MAGRFRARSIAIALAVGAIVVGLLGGVAAAPAAAQVSVLTVPTVTGVSPTSGPVIGGTTVTITGNFFTSGATVNFGPSNPSPSVTFVNSTTLKAASPAAAATGTVDVTVTTAGGTSVTSAADHFTYTGPTVTGVSPASGPAAGGTTVTISGTGYTTATTVKFGANAATPVTFVSSTVLKVTSPPGAAGTVDVTVTTAGLTSATSALDHFTYNSGPTVTGVSPASGPAAGGTVVTITGTGFTSAATVKFGANAGTGVTFVSSTALKATSPAGSGTVDVQVTVGTNTSAVNTADKYTYSSGLTVNGVSPASGPAAGGTVVTITGTGFTSAATVKFGANAGTGVTFVSSTALKATSPAGSGTVDVQVTVGTNTSAVNTADKFTYTSGTAPTVTGVSPASGPTTGGTVVTITGTNFAAGATVSFVTVGAGTNVQVVSSTVLKATSPAATTAGKVDVTVTTTGGTSATSTADKFNYRAGPTVTGVSPAGGPVTGGTAVTITGTGFTSAATVAFGGIAATPVTFVNSTTLTTTSPAGTGTGTVDVQVTTTGGTSPQTAADQFTYRSTTMPTVTGVSPAGGPTAGGTTVTITGTNFTSAATVAFGANAATPVTFVNSTTLKVPSPAAAAAGTVDVQVTVGANTSPITTADHFTYRAGPTVTGVSPAGGPVAGGTTVTITGTGFTSAATVAFGANAATPVTFVNSTTLKVPSPAAAAAGTVDVQVTVGANTSPITTADHFTYRAGPTVTGVSPPGGPVAGGTTVTITGTGFTSAATVAFGANAATPVTFVNSTTLKVPSPAAAAAGTVDVQVTVGANTSPITTADHFNYRAAPTVTGVSPASGATAGGTTVTITGTGFTNAATVDFGPSNPAPTVTFINSTTLKVTSPPGAAGTVNVTVTTAGGTSATSAADQYTYL